MDKAPIKMLKSSSGVQEVDVMTRAGRLGLNSGELLISFCVVMMVSRDETSSEQPKVERTEKS